MKAESSSDAQAPMKQAQPIRPTRTSTSNPTTPRKKEEEGVKANPKPKEEKLKDSHKEKDALPPKEVTQSTPVLKISEKELSHIEEEAHDDDHRDFERLFKEAQQQVPFPFPLSISLPLPLPSQMLEMRGELGMMKGQLDAKENENVHLRKAIETFVAENSSSSDHKVLIFDPMQAHKCSRVSAYVGP